MRNDKRKQEIAHWRTVYRQAIGTARIAQKRLIEAGALDPSKAAIKERNGYGADRDE